MTRPPSDDSFTGIFSRAVVLTVALTVTAWFLADRYLRPTLLVPDAEPRVVTPRGNLAESEQSVIELFDAAAPSVVHVKTSRRGAILARYVEVPEGAGTGFVWDGDGHIVTNYHVIQSADAADVYFAGDRDPYPARLVGYDADADLAVLKIESLPRRLHPIPLGSSADLRVGQTVLAIGNPFGLDQTLTTGVISGLNRSIRSISDMPIHGVIQTDAAINPGNSGGPLLDSAGRLIGVNTSIKSPTGAYAGIGFAVPVDLVNQRVPRILRDGFAERAGLGIVVGPDKWATDIGLRGAVVDHVIPRTGAEEAGIRPTRQGEDGVIVGDVIVALDGTAVEGREDLMSRLNAYGDGDVVRVTVKRRIEGEDRELDLAVQLRPLPR